MDMERFELIIIGAGPAGLSAAISAKKLGLTEILVLDRLTVPGGMLTQCFHRGFGYAKYGEELTGTDYAARLLEEAGKDIEIRTDSFITELSRGRIATVSSGSGGVYRIAAGAVILATGCRERPIGTLPVFGTRPAGVFTAGSVQRMMNLSGYRIGSKSIVLGSGDVGMIVSHHLTVNGTRVLAVIEKENRLGGLYRNKQRYIDPNGIPVITSRTVTRLHGGIRLEAVTVCQVDKNGKPIPGRGYRIECDTLVTSVGLIPELELIRGFDLEFSGDRLICDDERTGIPWLFICGNARRVHSLVDSVTSEGERAGILAAEYLHASSSPGN